MILRVVLEIRLLQRMCKMANVVIYKNNSDNVLYFLLDCVVTGVDYVGTNGKVSGIKPRHYSFLWTNDIAIFDSDTGTWDKKVSDFILCDPGAVVTKTSPFDIEQAIKRRSELANMSYLQIEMYINNNVVDLDSARQYLIKLSKTVLGIVKIQDR